MAQGTITLTNGSKNVTGSGTNFSTFAPGSFISVTLTGVVYTIAIDSIGSDTSLTLSVPFDGPTVSGASFVYSDVGSMALATMGVTVQAQKALRMMIADATNWRGVFSDQQTITVTLPDGTQYSGYSWGYISQLLKDINVPNLEAIRDQTAASAAAAAQSETNAHTHSQNSLAYAQQSGNSAAAALQSERNAAVHSGNASTSATNAHNSEVASANSAASSAQSASNAQQWAAAVNPDNILHKTDNLSGLVNLATSRSNIGLGAGDAVTFGNVLSQNFSDAANINGGILRTTLFSTSGDTRAASYYYSEVRGDNLQYATISVSNGPTTRYLGFNINGMLTGVEGAIIGNSGIASSGDIYVNQPRAIGIKTTSGGNKNLTLNVVGGDSSVGNWVNLLQGNWYDGYWQLGGVRGQGTDIDHFKIGINNQGRDWKEFKFFNSYSGHMAVTGGIAATVGRSSSWLDPYNYMGAPYWVEKTQRNDAGHVPIVSGGTVSTGGYATQSTFGMISGGSGNWPSATISMVGDGANLRIFTFGVDGNLTTSGGGGWDSTSYTFTRQATSDRTLKHDIVYTEGKESFERVMQWLPTMFKYNGQDVQRFGLIAQDLQAIDPQYVNTVKGGPKIAVVDVEDEETGEMVKRGKETGEFYPDTLAIDNNVLMTDMACALHYLGGVVQDIQSKLADQTSK